MNSQLIMQDKDNTLKTGHNTKLCKLPANTYKMYSMHYKNMIQKVLGDLFK